MGYLNLYQVPSWPRNNNYINRCGSSLYDLGEAGRNQPITPAIFLIKEPERESNSFVLSDYVDFIILCLSTFNY